MVRAKLGTMPETLVIDGRCKVEVGRVLRVRKAGWGYKWFKARLDRISGDCYFFTR